MEIGSEETSSVMTVTDKPDLTAAREPRIDETQREIVTTILERLKDPHAVNLVYPQEWLEDIPNYDKGGERRFLVLERSPFLGTDQICIAATNNKSPRGNNISQGSTMGQIVSGSYSRQEISLTRFVQTPSERFKHGGNQGTYYSLVLSNNGIDPNLEYIVGTGSWKGRANPNREHPPAAPKEGIPTFAERWRAGNYQLLTMYHYATAGQRLDFKESDYRDILKALKTAKVNSQMTSKVASSEEKYHYAKQNAPQLPE